MTVHFVTTGMSLREHSRCWTDANGDALDELDGPAEKLSKDDKCRLEAIRDDVFEQLCGDEGSNASDIVGRRFRPEVWSYSRGHLMSAELNTLVKMATPTSDHPRLINPGDEIHLLAGTSNRHECALLEAILDQMAPRHLPAVTVTMSEPRPMDPTSPAGFAAGMSAVWESISARDRKGAGISLVLTGGYKAVLVDLACRIGYEQMTARLYYTYEGEAAGLITIAVDRGQPARLDDVRGA